MLDYFGIMLPSDVSFLQATTSCSSGVLRLFLVLLLLLLLHTEQIIIEFDWILNQQLTHICSLRPVNTIQETVSANLMFIVTLARQREAFAATSCDLSLKEKKGNFLFCFFSFPFTNAKDKQEIFHCVKTCSCTSDIQMAYTSVTNRSQRFPWIIGHVLCVCRISELVPKTFVLFQSLH